MSRRLRAMMRIALMAGLGGCDARAPVVVVRNGDPSVGRTEIAALGCGSCHTVPGVTAAVGLVGPPLDRFALRIYIAGELPNSAGNLVTWIRSPQSIEPGTAMPNLGVSEQQARDIAAYLYTLR